MVHNPGGHCYFEGATSNIYQDSAYCLAGVCTYFMNNIADSFPISHSFPPGRWQIRDPRIAISSAKKKSRCGTGGHKSAVTETLVFCYIHATTVLTPNRNPTYCCRTNWFECVRGRKAWLDSFYPTRMNFKQLSFCMPEFFCLMPRGWFYIVEPSF